MVLGSNLTTMLAKIGVCLFAFFLGLYGAWWVSFFVHVFYVEKAESFDALSQVMFMSFLLAATLLCPLLSWLGLRVLKNMALRHNSK